ncbi:MAG TPA: hypothetical protein VF384_01990 [Planctomycetota bacterium]
MISHPLRLAAIALLLGVALPGQEIASSQPLLRVASNDARWVGAFAQMLGLAAPVLQAGQHVELIVPSTGAPRASTSEDPFQARTLVVEVRAAGWLQQRAEAVATAERDITTRVEGFAKLAQFPAAAARDLCASVFALARSLESANVVVTQVDKERRYDIRIELVPVPDSAFARWLPAITPSTTSAAHLTWSDVALRLDLALAHECFATACEPFLPLVAALGIHRRDATAAQHELRTLLPLLDGSFHVTLAPGRLGFVYGLHDAEAFAARTLDGKRLQQETEALGSQGIEAEFTPAAQTHRGVPMLRSRVRGRQPLPGLGNDDGDVVSFGARVRNLWLQIGGGKAPEGPMKSAIDDVLDGRLRGSPAASSEGPSAGPPAWLTCEVHLDRLGVSTATPRDAASTADDVPRRVCLSVRSSPQSLKALIQLR